MAAGSKRWALAFYFPVRICYMFFISKYRSESDLGLCTTSGLAKRMQLLGGDFWRILRPNTFLNWNMLLRIQVGIFLQVLRSCTNLNMSLLYILMWEIHSKFVWKNRMLALSVCFPQSCSSAGCRVTMSRSRLGYYQTNFLVFTETNSMKRVVNWIPLHTHKIISSLTELFFRANLGNFQSAHTSDWHTLHVKRVCDIIYVRASRGGTHHI